MRDTPAVIAFVAALGLIALTAAVAIRPSADLNFWRIGTMALAWVAVLATALAVRDRAATMSAADDQRELDAASRGPDTGSARAEAHVPPGSAALLEFVRELHGTLETDRLRLLISRRLPVLLGVRDVWIVVRLGNRQQIIVPTAGGEAIPLISDEPREWATYPMKTDGQTIGLLGAALPARGFTEQEHRMFKQVASLVAQSLATATAFEAMREASLVDPLTGCATRAEGARRLEAELRRAQRAGTSLAVLMLDLDHFKSINDRFGHKTGDAALTAVGETLLTTLRASDVRCRWGGEEFLLVLPDSNVERAQRASDKLRQRIANTPVGTGDQVVHVTASVGLTLSMPGETDVQQLITRADTGLYDAKRTGRNRTSIVLPGQAARPGGAQARSDTTAAPAEPVIGHPREVVSARVGDKWDGLERRDGMRRDRRRVPSPGRRSTDAVRAGPWRDR